MTYENALVLRLALATGLRVGDCVKVRVEDIKGRTLYYTAEKTGKSGKKVIDKGLADELRRLGGSGYVFKHRTRDGQHRTRQAVWNDVKKACKLARIPEHVSPHSARKTYAVTIRDEYGVERAREELQHDKLDVTMLYAFSDLLSSSERPVTGRNENLIQDIYNVCFAACCAALAKCGLYSDLTLSGK